MSSDPAITARHVSKEYAIRSSRGDHGPGNRLRGLLQRPQTELFRALDDVSFEVQRGKVLGIIGHNGAGKSTVLKILSRTTRPTSGEVRLYGRVGSLLEVGTGFHPELSGRENIFLNGSILGMQKPAIRRAFDAIVDFAEIHRFVDTPVKRYSSGMYMRLAFAIAAHLDPEILIVDEVLAVGDAAFQAKCLGKMHEVSGEGRTVVFVSHNMAAIETLCNTALYLDRGKVAVDGAVPEAMKAYLASTERASGETNPGIFAIPPGPNGERPLQRLELRRGDDSPTSVVQMGDHISFLLDVGGLGPHPRPYFGLRIRTAAGQIVCGINTAMKEGLALSSGEAVRAVFTIPRLALAPGEYWVDAGVGTRSGDEVLDYAEHAGQLTVVPGDFYGSSYGLTAGEGLVFFDFDWRTESVENDEGV